MKVTAEDVKFAIEYYANADNKSSLKSRVNTIDHVDVMDLRTAVIVTAKPDPIIPRRQHLVFILPKHIFNDASKGKEFQAEQAVGQRRLHAYVVHAGGADPDGCEPLVVAGNQGTRRR